jgi:hypoxanthine phosphoribosyltransferase
VSDYLHIKDIATIKVEHWGIAATPDEKAVLKFPLNADIRKKRVLLVDDISDTGDTLKVSIPYLESFAPEEIKSATLLHKTTSRIAPDYFVRKITRWRWVIFPWHVWEDLTLFIKEITAERPRSATNVHRELKDRFSLDVSASMVREILDEVGRLRSPHP